MGDSGDVKQLEIKTYDNSLINIFRCFSLFLGSDRIEVEGQIVFDPSRRVLSWWRIWFGIIPEFK